MYVLSTSKRLPRADRMADIANVRQPLTPLENITESQRIRNTEILQLRLSTMEERIKVEDHHWQRAKRKRLQSR